MNMKRKLFALAIILLPLCASAQQETNGHVSDPFETSIVNGVPWTDDQGRPVNAHGACIVEEKGVYYLFGEWKSDTTNAFPGFACYSSRDLVNWKFERVALPLQKDGLLGPNRVGERPKVMRCPRTGEYIMLAHTDNMRYKDPQVGLAVAKNITGPYTFIGPLLYKGEPIRRWDMGTFQDHDGTGYLLMHHGDIYRLSKDYRKAVKKVASGIKGGGESPAMLHKDGVYYLFGSNLTSWERNDNFYHTATDIEGPWTKQGIFCPEGTLTYNSQSTFILPLHRGDSVVYMYMGDRWSYPHQASSATYVWMPLQIDGLKLSIPQYWPVWNPATMQPVTDLGGEVIKVSFKADRKGAKLELPFEGTRIALIGHTFNNGGYGRISILDKSGNTVHTNLIDFYSKVDDHGLRYVSPQLPHASYTLVVECAGEHPQWSDKRKSHYGSHEDWVTVEEVRVY
ncbi:MAG: family 43 glycosylhydrolase [Bacteroidaceae bacterium]|nr:family 43 glycosylhydrolase [Bacteroidaceae bacterium]